MFGLKVALAFFVNRLKEPSTWGAIALGAGAVAHSLQSNVGLGAAILAGIAAVFIPEK